MCCYIPSLGQPVGVSCSNPALLSVVASADLSAIFSEMISCARRSTRRRLSTGNSSIN